MSKGESALVAWGVVGSGVMLVVGSGPFSMVMGATVEVSGPGVAEPATVAAGFGVGVASMPIRPASVGFVAGGARAGSAPVRVSAAMVMIPAAAWAAAAMMSFQRRLRPGRTGNTLVVAPGASTNLTGGGPLPGAATRVLRVRPDRSRRWKLIMIAAVLAAAGILTIKALTLTGADPAPAPPATNPTDAGRTGISAAPTPSVVAPAAGLATPGPDGPAAPVVTEPDPTTSIAPPPTTTQATSADTTLSAESPPDATDPAITNPNEPKGKDKDPKTNGNNGEPKKTKQNNGQ